ncbi:MULTISPECIES: acetyltransferase [unclassified Sphingopyxis]|jgi:sugar O-acyltransferase (sialic acid O-acetyltransferase NeuD family)|uniref:acetyltransferase n=1 Tax=unclassified Sphingopyxis TaxID=2614943 RepID=UPI0025F8DF15|nr:MULTISPECIES: acetyltransferase [unclassified Sphingopyxis]
MRLIGIYGASGFGREVMPIAREQYERNGDRLVFIDDDTTRSVDRVNKHEIFTWDSFLRAGSFLGVAIAIADAPVREKLMERCTKAGVAICEIRASNAVIGDDVLIGEGSILQPFSSITSNVRIGRGFHANIYSYVAHDCIIGDFVTLAPGAKCNGNVHIHDYAYVGTGAILRQGTAENPLVVGAGAVIGMGAVVTKNVPPGETVIGNPARLLQKK